MDSVHASHLVRATGVDPLRAAVRHGLRLPTTMIAAALTLPIAPSASAAAFPPVFQLPSLLTGTGTAGFVLDGDDKAGYSVSGAGDVNADGVDERGDSYVVFGPSRRFRRSVIG